MAQYKVLKPFRDKETKEVYEENAVIEMTVKRADEAIKNLKKWDGTFLERIDKVDEPTGETPDGETPAKDSKEAADKEPKK